MGSRNHQKQGKAYKWGGEFSARPEEKIEKKTADKKVTKPEKNAKEEWTSAKLSENEEKSDAPKMATRSSSQKKSVPEK